MVYDSTKKLSDSTCLSIGLPKKFLTPTYKTFQGKTKSELWKLATNHKVASALDWHSHEATIESFWIHPANRPSAKDIFISQSSIFRGYLKFPGCLYQVFGYTTTELGILLWKQHLFFQKTTWGIANSLDSNRTYSKIMFLCILWTFGCWDSNKRVIGKTFWNISCEII